MRQYADNVTGPAKDRLYVWFDPDLIPGYAWSFPLPGGRVNIGFGLLRDGQRKMGDIKSLWPDLLQRPHIREALGDGAVMEGRHTAWPIPARIDTAALASGRVLFTGDAAMATDSLTGEGIGQALLTGRLAAEAIVAAGALAPATARATYEREVAAHLFADHRLSVLLGKVLAASGAPAAPYASSASTPGPAATSPGGCSRTSPARSPSPPPAGTANSSAATAPTPDAVHGGARPTTRSGPAARPGRPGSRGVPSLANQRA